MDYIFRCVYDKTVIYICSHRFLLKYGLPEFCIFAYWLAYCAVLNSFSLLVFLSSYKRFIPESLNRSIKQRSFMTRIRINNVFKKFLSEFHQRTIRDSNITPYDLKIKYLATLEGLTSGLGSEVFEPISLIVAQEGELFNGGYYGKFSDQIIILYQCLEWFYVNWQYTNQINFKYVGGKSPLKLLNKLFTWLN